MKTRLRITAALFFPAGFAIILAGTGINNTTVSSVAGNPGVAFIAIPLLDYLWWISGGNPLSDQIDRMTAKLNAFDSSLSILASGKSVGLDKAYRRQGDYGAQADWENLIRNASREVDVMGRAAYGWVNSNDLDQLLIRKLQSATRIQIVPPIVGRFPTAHFTRL